MSKSMTLAAIVLLAIGVVPAPAAAAAGGADLSIGIKFGLSSQSTRMRDFGYEFTKDIGATYGFRLGARSGRFGLEVSYFYASQGVRPIGANPPIVRIERLRLSNVSVNVLAYILPASPINPYMTVGYGTYRLHLDPSAGDANDGPNVGGGVDIRILKRVSLSAEGKRHWVRVALYGNKVNIGDWTWNFGVNFHF
jgi:Outer membrane protein beta-barrel domain